MDEAGQSKKQRWLIHEYATDVTTEGMNAPVITPLIEGGGNESHDVHGSVLPEEKLLFAVLLEALGDIRAAAVRQEKARVDYALDALEWMQLPNDTYFYSYRTICAHFGINPDLLAAGVVTAYIVDDGDEIERIYQMASAYYCRMRA